MKKFLLSFAAFTARILPPTIKTRMYQIKPLARLVRGTLNRAAPAGLTEITVAAGGAAGMKMELDLQTEKDYWLGTYETDLQAAIADLLEPGWTVYDVGANIGFVSLLLAKKLGESGKIFAFEALPDNLERLNAHVEINGLASVLRVIPGAVAATSEPVRFLVGPSGAMGKAEGSAGRTESHREAIEIPGISLDDFIYRDGNPPPQAIKMDIEGGEVLALQGMPRLMAEVRPLIFLELHGPEAARFTWEALTAAGYKICRMQRGYPRVSSLDELDWKAYLVADTMKFAGCLALQQRVIPAYRAPFIDLLAESCVEGLSLFAGKPLPVESIATTVEFSSARYTPAQNRHFSDPQSSLYLCRQEGIIEWLETQNPDALIVEANPRYLSNRRAVRWMKQLHRPVLGWGLGAPRDGNPIERFFRLNFLRSLDGVIAYSRRGADEYRALGLKVSTLPIMLQPRDQNMRALSARSIWKGHRVFYSWGVCRNVNESIFCCMPALPSLLICSLV